MRGTWPAIILFLFAARDAAAQVIERKLHRATDAAATHLFLENPAALVAGPTRAGVVADLHHSADPQSGGATVAGYLGAAAVTSMGAGLGFGVTAQTGAQLGMGLFVSRSLAPRLTYALTKQTAIGLQLTHLTFSAHGGAPIIARDQSDYSSGYATGSSFGIVSQGEGWNWEVLYRREAVGKANAGEQRITSVPASFGLGLAYDWSPHLRLGADVHFHWFDRAAEAVLMPLEDENGQGTFAQLALGLDVREGSRVWHVTFARELALSGVRDRMRLAATFGKGPSAWMAGAEVLMQSTSAFGSAAGPQRLTGEDVYLGWCGNW